MKSLSNLEEGLQSPSFICRCCNVEKQAEEFSKHRQCKRGYDISRCKECKKAHSVASNRWATKPLELKILSRVKSRATLKDIPFDLTVEDINIPEVCPVFGVPFIYGDHLWTYSVDRINPQLGYVRGNIIIISNKANMMKSSATTEEIGMLHKYLLSLEM